MQRICCILRQRYILIIGDGWRIDDNRIGLLAAQVIDIDGAKHHWIGTWHAGDAAEHARHWIKAQSCWQQARN